MSNKSKITPKLRENEFPEDFKVLGEELYCIHCDHPVSWKKLSTLNDHLASNQHIRSKLGGKPKKPSTIKDTFNFNDKKQAFVQDFVEMMVTCNIPLTKKDKMASWLSNYVPNAGWILSSNTLRRDYLPKVMNKHKLEIKNKIQDQPLSIMIDSSPDRLSRNVVNIIVNCGFTGERFLLDTQFANEVNNITLFNLIENVRQEYELKWKNLETLVCDSASSNKSCIRL